MKISKINSAVFKKKIGILIKLFSVVLFVSVSLYVFFSVNPHESDIENYDSLTNNNLNQYNRTIKTQKKETDKLLENRQLNDMIEGKEFLENNVYKKRKSNLFMKLY